MKTLRIVLCLSILFTLSACVGAVKVNDSGFGQSAKKVAFVSVYSNPGVMKKGSDTSGAKAASLISSVAGAVFKKKKKGEEESKVAEVASFGGNHLIEYTLDRFTEEFNSYEMMEVMPYDEVVNSEAYIRIRDAYVAEIKGRYIFNALYTPVPEMFAYGFYRNKSAGYKELRELCAELNVDAVVVVSLIKSYDTWIGINSTGAAKAYVGLNFAIVDKDGTVIASTPQLPFVGGGYSGPYFDSDKKTAIVAGIIAYTQKTKEMYEQGIDKAVDFYKEELEKALYQALSE